ncbi:hypothetical protein B0H13DRAFT_1906919 [Mycena leptocephala]|nr:hypothetical protein B0H13DRAFT_1906919 [Mycena leptocephala]
MEDKEREGTGRNAPKSHESDDDSPDPSQKVEMRGNHPRKTYLGWDRTELGLAAEDGTGQWIVGSMQWCMRSTASHWARESIRITFVLWVGWKKGLHLDNGTRLPGAVVEDDVTDVRIWGKTHPGQYIEMTSISEEGT